MLITSVRTTADRARRPVQVRSGASSPFSVRLAYTFQTAGTGLPFRGRHGGAAIHPTYDSDSPRRCEPLHACSDTRNRKRLIRHDAPLACYLLAQRPCGLYCSSLPPSGWSQLSPVAGARNARWHRTQAASTPRGRARRESGSTRRPRPDSETQSSGDGAAATQRASRISVIHARSMRTLCASMMRPHACSSKAGCLPGASPVLAPGRRPLLSVPQRAGDARRPDQDSARSRDAGRGERYRERPGCAPRAADAATHAAGPRAAPGLERLVLGSKLQHVGRERRA